VNCPPVTVSTVTSGGTWQVVASQPADGSLNLCNPLLLTDGTVIAHHCHFPDWWKLSPDNTGSYVNGTWAQIASLPVINGTQYAPEYQGSAVLPDGRVIIMGGQFNGTDASNTNLGAIYDPITDTWTPVAAPSGASWSQIGNAPGIVLPNGTSMLGSCCASPPVDALLNASTLSWTATGAPGNNTQIGQSYTVLQTGKVLTIDVWDPPNAQQYDPATGLWTAIASAPVSLVSDCGYSVIGPALTRPDGTVVAFGGNPGCTASPANPTAIYAPSSNSWVQGPNVPAIGGVTYINQSINIPTFFS
jgi:Kelch motif